MVEIHGWITLRETFKAVDEDNFETILEQVQNEIQKLKYSKLQIKSMDGECFIEFSSYSNHVSDDTKELLFFYEKVGKIAKGSYGLLYMYNDEDKDNYNNFVIYRLTRGRVKIFQDKLLSPIIPVIEDMDCDFA